MEIPSVSKLKITRSNLQIDLFGTKKLLNERGDKPQLPGGSCCGKRQPTRSFVAVPPQNDLPKMCLTCAFCSFKFSSSKKFPSGILFRL